MGVWIEIYHLPLPVSAKCVTPYVGVWIEIPKAETGLSFSVVTPYVGVWIEIIDVTKMYKK